VQRQVEDAPVEHGDRHRCRGHADGRTKALARKQEEAESRKREQDRRDRHQRLPRLDARDRRHRRERRHLVGGVGGVRRRRVVVLQERGAARDEVRVRAEARDGREPRAERGH
jgi:hypothetical protein